MKEAELYEKFFQLLAEYKHNNAGDLMTLYCEIGSLDAVNALENADGRKILLGEHPDFKGEMVCDPPLIWKYGRRYVSPEENHSDS